jgi:uncharacterized lipoprotein YehR (DUF1307 family)
MLLSEFISKNSSKEDFYISRHERKKKMKKTLSLILAILLSFCLVACGQNAATPSASTPSASAPVASAPVASTPPAASGPVAEEVKGVTIPAFSVTVNGVAVDQKVMAAYPMYSVQATSVNSAGTESTITYIGFAMGDVLAAAGLKEAYVWLEATADDGYAVTVKGETVLAATTLLAMTKDGEPFGAAPWFAPCTSETTGDYLKGCVSLLVNTTDGAPAVSAAPSGGGGGELALTGELPEIMDKTGKVEFAPYSFLVNGKAVTNDTLKGLSIYKITVVVENKSGELSESTYTGYMLQDVLKACGIASPAAVKAIANDGYETELAAALIASEYTLVAIEKDKEVGEDGTIWVAPCSETASKSYCKLVTEITAS